MKIQYSALSVVLLGLGALATQSCEFTDDQSSYRHGDRSGYYHEGGYGEHHGYYPDGPYGEENGYYHQRRYTRDDYQSNRPSSIDVQF